MLGSVERQRIMMTAASSAVGVRVGPPALEHQHTASAGDRALGTQHPGNAAADDTEIVVHSL